MTHWLHPEAEKELAEAARYYAQEASPVIARAFLDQYQRARDRVVENPHLGRPADTDLRLYHLDRFPYSLIYAIDAVRGPQIFAVAHQSRGPGYWSRRVQRYPR